MTYKVSQEHKPLDQSSQEGITQVSLIYFSSFQGFRLFIVINIKKMCDRKSRSYHDV